MQSCLNKQLAFWSFDTHLSPSCCVKTYFGSPFSTLMISVELFIIIHTLLFIAENFSHGRSRFRARVLVRIISDNKSWKTM